MVLDWYYTGTRLVQKAIDEKEPLPRRFQAHMKLLPPCYQYGGYVFRAEHRASKNGIFWLFDKLGAEMLNSIIRHPQTEYRRDTLKKPVKSTFFDFLCVTLCDTYMCHPR